MNIDSLLAASPSLTSWLTLASTSGLSISDLNLATSRPISWA